MRTILNFPNYMITVDGRIWSKLRQGSGCSLSGRWKKLRLAHNGYLRVVLSHKGRKKNLPVHRLVLEAYLGPRPLGRECHHLDSNKTNNSIKNLVWCTNNQNGERNSNNKLIKEQVRVIFHAYHDGYYTQEELAIAFGVTRRTVGKIINKKLWGHLWAA